jgi:hypothetical protein
MSSPQDRETRAAGYDETFNSTSPDLRRGIN